ncbi:MAG: type II secretion system protein [Patescibacteria group bacterium]
MQTQNKNPIVPPVAEFWRRVSGGNRQSLIVNRSCRGFSLVEMIVSLGIFTIVLFIATSAFLTVVNADRKSRATRIAMDNLNLALEDMSRRIKTGSSYNCGATVSSTNDCSSSDNETSFKFIDQENDTVIYKLGSGPSGCLNNNLYKVGQGCILRTIPYESPLFMLATSPEIDITKLKFIVSGSTFGDSVQPVAVIMVEGSLGVDPKKTTFKVQTTITQRKVDKPIL